jgi:hypothetical protein
MFSGETLTDDWVGVVQVVKSQSLAVQSLFFDFSFWGSTGIADVDFFYGSRRRVLRLRKGEKNYTVLKKDNVLDRKQISLRPP